MTIDLIKELFIETRRVRKWLEEQPKATIKGCVLSVIETSEGDYLTSETGLYVTENVQFATELSEMSIICEVFKTKKGELIYAGRCKWDGQKFDF